MSRPPSSLRYQTLTGPTSPWPYVTLVLTNPGPYVIIAWQAEAKRERQQVRQARELEREKQRHQGRTATTSERMGGDKVAAGGALVDGEDKEDGLDGADAIEAFAELEALLAEPTIAELPVRARARARVRVRVSGAHHR